MLPLLLFLAGCNDGGGKRFFDLIQLMLRQEGSIRWIFCFILVIVLWQFIKLFRAGFRFFRWTLGKVKPVIFRPRLRNILIAAVVGTIFWAMSDALADMLQDIEQRYFTPVWLGQYADLNEAHLTAIYETELAQKVDPYELAIIKKRTAEMAVKIHSTPLAIYECAWLECGLNPFTVRRDKVAAGWIQFTRNGLGGLKYNGQNITFEQVLYACKTRNIELMMDLSEIYLIDKFERAKKLPMNNTIDLYLALFAPAYIGAPHQKVVYQGVQNASYYLNKGLDGWYVQQTQDNRQQIFRKNAACDGAITVWEIYLALEAKKGQLASRYIKR